MDNLLQAVIVLNLWTYGGNTQYTFSSSFARFYVRIKTFMVLRHN